MAPKNNKRSLRKKAFQKKNKPPKTINSEEEEILCGTEKMIDLNNEFLYNKYKEEEKKLNLEKKQRVEDITSKSNYEEEIDFPKLSKTEEIDFPKLSKTEEIDFPKLSKIDVLGEVLKVLKSDSQKTEFPRILQDLFNTLNTENQRKQKMLSILITFTEILRNCNKADLDFISEKCRDILLPKELLDIVTKKKEQIKEERVVGRGGFGTVAKGKFWRRENNASMTLITVAIKSAVNPSKISFLKNEAAIMCQLNHPNIVKIIAFQKKPMKLVMEYLELDNLTDLLVKRCFRIEILYAMICDIVSGMEYMSQKKIIHRDLGTRNIFVNSDLKCKVGDFGLSCYVGHTDGIYMDKDNQLGGMNIPPESRVTQTFTTKSDVWAMGLVIWEIFFLNYSEDDFFSFQAYKHHLMMFRITEQLLMPPYCPDSVFRYIRYMMTEEPEKRPSFTHVKHFFDLQVKVSKQRLFSDTFFRSLF